MWESLRFRASGASGLPSESEACDGSQMNAILTMAAGVLGFLAGMAIARATDGHWTGSLSEEYRMAGFGLVLGFVFLAGSAAFLVRMKRR